MLPDSREQFLHAKIDRFDRLMKYTGLAAAFAALGLLVFIVVLQYQTQAQISQNLTDLKAAAKINHDETRSYFRCIADALTQPLATRENAFDQCGINVDGTNTQSTGTSQSVMNVPSVAPQLEPTTTVVPEQVTTSAPPDPTTPQSNNNTITTAPPSTTPAGSGQKDFVHGIPVVGNLLDLLKL